MLILDRSFFEQNTVKVAEQLIGKKIILKNFSAIITETEAYHGFDDLASHGARGLTKRNAPMYGEAGLLYVYLIYGIHHCLNIVTEKANYPSAVLIRGVKLDKPYSQIINGPGKLCKFFEIDRGWNNMPIGADTLQIIDENIDVKYKATERVGISKSRELLWRFLAWENH